MIRIASTCKRRSGRERRAQLHAAYVFYTETRATYADACNAGADAKTLRDIVRQARWARRRAAWYSFGTCHLDLDAAAPAGILNSRLGL